MSKFQAVSKGALAAALVSAAATFAPAAWAQDAALDQAPVAEDPPAEEADGGVILVTAQKRTQDVQDVPISMSVVGGDKLADLDIKDFTELDRFVPNFYVQASPGNNAFYSRGIGSTPGNLAFEQTVGLFVDGIYGGHARQFQAPFLDVERIEVLRGPQGALVGKNTSAGAISVISARPTRVFHASVEATHEFEIGGDRLFGMVSGPVSDVVSARLAAQWEDSDGYVRNTDLGTKDGGRKSVFARGSVLIAPGNGAELLFRLEGGKVDLDGTPAERNLTAADPDLRRDGAGFPGFVGQDFDDTDTLNGSVTGTFEIGEHTLTTITGYSSYDFQKRIDSDFRTANGSGSEFAETFDQLSQEVRLTSPTTGALEYVAGIYGHINDYDLYQSTRTAANLSERLFDQENTVWSAYGSATYKFSPALRLTGSLRYTHDHKDANQRVQNVSPVTGNIVPIRRLVGDRTEREWDPSVNFQWDATDNAMLYLSWGEGSKAGGFIGGQATTLQNQFEIDPEKSETWEAGTKLALLDRRLLLNVAAYRTTFRDLQVSTFDAAASLATGTNVFLTKNAGRARSQGIEGDVAFEVIDGVNLTGSIAYLDAKYLDFLGAPCPASNPTCTVAANNAAGRPLPRTPKWSGTVGFDAAVAVGDDFELVGSGNMSFRSRVFLEDTYNPLAIQQANQKLDLRLGVRTADRRWEVALVGKNLTDELTASHGFNTPGLAPSTPGGITKFILPPRTIALQAKFTY
jgi:iron complex outermembrane receptor protein